jgi:putative DNA methylase
MEQKKKLIEVALPLEAINAESAREKSIRHGHPSTLHLWWSRKPTATARAVIFASLVDDPSSHPEEFPSEEAQTKERQRLFDIISRLVVWENSNNQDVLNEAKAEILKSTDGNPPALLDPFAGGGSIPLEAQRLGLEAHASDLNPVAVMINKAMIEIPPKFAGQPPVNPDAQMSIMQDSFTGAQGLAEDVRYYGEWMKKKAFERIGHLYPKVKVPKEQGGGEATVIAWIWARSVKCPNPACGCEMPLSGSFELTKKKNKEAYIQPIFDGNKIRYEVKHGKGAPVSAKTSRGANFKCICCGEATTSEYIKDEAIAGRMGLVLMAIVAEGNNGRIYISPDEEQIKVAQANKPENYPSQELAYDPRNIWCVNYGLNTYDKLFTNRQLIALTTLSNLISDIQMKVHNDGGTLEYAQAITTYLAFAIDREANRLSTLCVWNRVGEKIEQTFARQAIPMMWEFAENYDPKRQYVYKKPIRSPTPVYCITTKEKFESITSANKKHPSAPPSGISSNCKNEQYYSGRDDDTGEALVWMYYDEYKNSSDGEIKSRYDKGKSIATREYNARLVECINTGEIFRSIKRASDKYDIDPSDICNCCKGNKISAGADKNTGDKLYWKYA